MCLAVAAAHEGPLYRYSSSEIAEIISYIANDNPRAAQEVSRAIERTVASIEKRPELAPIVYEGKVRSRRVGRYQYRIFYTAEGDELMIRNVRSTRRLRPWEGI